MKAEVWPKDEKLKKKRNFWWAQVSVGTQALHILETLLFTLWCFEPLYNPNFSDDIFLTDEATFTWSIYL